MSPYKYTHCKYYITVIIQGANIAANVTLLISAYKQVYTTQTLHCEYSKCVNVTAGIMHGVNKLLFDYARCKILHCKQSVQCKYKLQNNIIHGASVTL